MDAIEYLKPVYFLGIEIRSSYLQMQCSDTMATANWMMPKSFVLLIANDYTRCDLMDYVRLKSARS